MNTYDIRFFNARSEETLQKAIDDWLQAHPDVVVIKTRRVSAEMIQDVIEEPIHDLGFSAAVMHLVR